VRRTLRAAAAGALVVHAHGALPAAACVAAGIGPLVVSWHNAPTGSRLRRLGHRVADRLAAGSADLVLVASPDLAAAARRAGARAVRFMPLPAPPLPAPSGPPARLRARLGLGNRPVVLAVARLAPQKRLDLLVRAAAGWTEPQSPVVLVAGSGPEEARLRGLAAQLGAPVRFLGHRDDVADLLAVADVAVLPSEWEARPFVVQEALRAGVPVVATAVGGIPHLVQGGAVLVPPDDVSALRAAVHDLLDDPVRRARLADAGREVASHWPTYGATVDEYLSAYLDLRSRSR
jgi:glycosyltransferase involved in cell wall biosynthesis